MITFDTYALDRVIDERIESAFEFGSIYGADLFDDEGNVGYHRVGFNPGHLLDILQSQQQQIVDLAASNKYLYNEIERLDKLIKEK